jgi:hypothetical protein
VFVVKATNGGDSLETNIPVRLVLRPTGQAGGDVIRRSVTIQQVQSGAAATVQVGRIFSAGVSPQFSLPYKLSVIVTPVPGERNPLNNRETYDLNFTVG